MLPPEMVAAGAQPVLLQFFAIELDVPNYPTIRLLDGSATISWQGKIFTGSNATFGTWAGMDTIDEGIATQAPKLKVTLNTISNAAAAQLCAPTLQGAPITIYEGYLDLQTGKPVCDPVTAFAGAIDIGHLVVSDNSKSVDLDVVSAFEFMFMNNEGAKLASSYHELYWPGELGFAFVDNVTHAIPWGLSGPRPDQVTNVDNWDAGAQLPGFGSSSGGLAKAPSLSSLNYRGGMR